VAHMRAAAAAESSLGMSAAAAAELRTNHQHRPEHYNDTDIGVASVADDNCLQRNTQSIRRA
jgi:hypothetical protein